MITSDAQQSQSICEQFLAKGIATSPELKRIASTISDAHFPGALIPLDNRGTRICAATPTSLEWLRLAPLLEARIAYELSSLPQVIQSGPVHSDVIDVLDGFAPVYWCVFRLAPDEKRRGEALAACGRLVANIAEHANLIDAPKAELSTAQLLSQFEAALTRKDFETAEAVLNVCRSRGSLDGLNLRCLRLRLLYLTNRDAPECNEIVRQLRNVPVPSNIKRLIDDVASS